jgi:hypothetical protein
MRPVLAATIVSLMVLGTARVGSANCAKDDPSGARVTAARQQVATDCVCDPNDPPTVNHGQYVKCAAAVANTRSGLDPNDANFLPRTCKGAVKKCAAHSTCGKPGFVTCCVTTGSGTKCKIAKEATCMKKSGTPTVDPNSPSCCSNTQPLTADACLASPSGAFLQ